MYEQRKYKDYIKEYIQLGLPIMIGSMAVVLISWGDTIMISKLGNDTALSAAQLANQICSIPFLFLIGISSILAPLVASSVMAHKNYEDASKNLLHLLTINLVFGFLSTILIISFSSKLHYLSQSTKVIALTQDYLCIIALSIIPNAITNAVKKYLEALGWTLHTMYLGIMAGGVNVGLNYMLIYGKLGFPELGLNGAGWATLATRIIFMCIYLGYVFFLKNKGYIISFSWKLWKESYFIKLFKLGLPSGLDLAVKMGYYTVAIIMLGWCSNRETAQASTGFLFDVVRFVLMLPLAISIASSILIGKQWGRKNKPAILSLVKTGYILSFVLMLFMGVILYLAYPFILSELYSPTESVQQLITSLFGLVILLQFVNGLQLVVIGMLKGLQDTFVPFILTALSYLWIGIPTSYIMAYHLNYQATGVWIGLTLGVASSACLLSIRLYYKTKHIKLPSHYNAL